MRLPVPDEWAPLMPLGPGIPRSTQSKPSEIEENLQTSCGAWLLLAAEQVTEDVADRKPLRQRV
jgi:hypothetical protein